MIDLTQAWLAILSRAKHTRHHEVTQETVSVRERMTAILRHLNLNDAQAIFSELFDVNEGITHVVVTFIALLELVKEGLIILRQDDDFGEIFVSRATNSDEENEQMEAV